MNDAPTSPKREEGISGADFSLVIGGPFYQLLRRTHLENDTAEMIRRRIVVFLAITWLPLFTITLLQGKILHAGGGVPFLLDFEVHTRFLVALPLLVLAELVVHRRMRHLLRQFDERHLIAESDRSRFEAAFASVVRLRNSIPAEGVLLAVVYGVGILIVWRQYIALDTTTWYATQSTEGSRLSLAGIWYGYVSLPIFQFLLCRWYFRMFIWARFLWQVSRLDLRLVPTHPDRMGGLGFLTTTTYAFVPVLVAHGTLLAGMIGSRIYHLGATLPTYKFEVLILFVFLVCLVLGPLLVFSFQLAATKRRGMREYGTLAERYVREFDTKWLRGGGPPGEPLVGSADIQSLADLGNSFEVVQTMRILPFGKEAVLQIAVATFAPVIPLLLTMMPLEELLKRLLGIVF